ncbi:uncharacterized protein HMPREF1541_05386 [Cyphellophora europaea CBS 101466]|uniref:AB hydrolase-1 domain-containing protein n=1 Tax=Cyphellophora europaea (strain CBS 101466) TaxID=1220924 RepID=W2RTS8_CYPE1|nr:uncharacterized protein HMPREF1541_05386 [Cyphellophora europaea CBS 101466]ETN39163.1 hypothetical protein HMPREF1541_05386 [Cyphellophora europaea CBS 101466]
MPYRTRRPPRALRVHGLMTPLHPPPSSLSRRNINTTSNTQSQAPSPPIPGDAITLPSGRQLGYHTAGPPTGTPIIYIHGHPDSGLSITGALETRAAHDRHVRWIGPDRPGVGLSTPYDAQEVLDYPSDIESLVAHLGLQRSGYYMVGTSGGTGFALACAKHLPPSELRGVGICAGVGPCEAGFASMSDLQCQALEAWRDHPAEFREWYETQYVPLAQLDDDGVALARKLRADFEAGFEGRDREVLLEENAFNMAVRVLRQAWCQGAWAHAKGMEFHWRPWGFRLEDVAFPGRVRLWYGGEDVSATPAMGRFMAERLGGDAVYREFKGESHYTLWREGNLQAMLRDLLGR